MSNKPPRVVIVTRQTEYEALLARHCTREQARFFLETRGQTLDAPLGAHARFEQALSKVLQAVPLSWRRTRVDRGSLDRFLFREDDVVVAIGQDGLVANTAKYLTGQPVIGINPDPERNEGVLVPHAPEAAADLLHDAAAGRSVLERRIMVAATLDDGQRLLALNELFLGHKTHQSARYEIGYGGSAAAKPKRRRRRRRGGRAGEGTAVAEAPTSEYQSSSGLIVSTGTGATGWARSVTRNRRTCVELPLPAEERLVFFVREAWPSVATGTTITDGVLTPGWELELTSRMNDDGVIFGDGIEADRIEWTWGRRVRVGLADTRLHLVRG